MKMDHHAERKHQTRTKIQAGGLLQKSGILEAFLISSGDDLQDYEHRKKQRACWTTLSQILVQQHWRL